MLLFRRALHAVFRRARAKGLTFISENVMRELFRNRLDYIRLQARAKAVKEGGKWGTTL